MKWITEWHSGWFAESVINRYSCVIVYGLTVVESRMQDHMYYPIWVVHVVHLGNLPRMQDHMYYPRAPSWCQ